MKKFIVNTKSESSDYYTYYIEHPTKPTISELDRFLKDHAHDRDEDRHYENIESVEEIKGFQKLK